VAKHAYKRLSTIVTSVKDLGDCHFEQGKPGTRKTFDEDSDASVGSQLPISSIKGDVKKKHLHPDRKVSCFPDHWIERDPF
jgi:hypothetical protein